MSHTSLTDPPLHGVHDMKASTGLGAGPYNQKLRDQGWYRRLCETGCGKLLSSPPWRHRVRMEA